MQEVLTKSANDFRDLTFKMTNVELAKIYRKDTGVIRKWKKDLEILGYDVGTGFPQSTSELCDQYIQINQDRVIIMGDAEIPDHDPEVFSMITDLAQKFDIHHLIINGDLVAFDSLSNWMRSTPYTSTFRKEMEITKETINVFLRHFKTVSYLTGNHERRLPHKVDGQIALGDFLLNTAGLTFSVYSYCYLTSGGKKILVCHPDNFSRIPLSVPLKIASVEHMNVVCAHTHRLSFGYDASSRYWVIDGGHCRDDKRTSYKAIKKNTYPNWNPGFVMIIDGFPHVIPKQDFNFWMSLRSNNLINYSQGIGCV